MSSSSFEKCILSGDVKSLKSFFGDLKKSFCVPLFPCPKEEEECEDSWEIWSQIFVVVFLQKYLSVKFAQELGRRLLQPKTTTTRVSAIVNNLPLLKLNSPSWGVIHIFFFMWQSMLNIYNSDGYPPTLICPPSSLVRRCWGPWQVFLFWPENEQDLLQQKCLAFNQKNIRSNNSPYLHCTVLLLNILDPIS